MTLTDYDFNQTRNEVIQRALRICGVLSLGESVSSDQYSSAITALNALVKDWQNEKIFLWTLRQDTVTALSATAATALSAEDPPPIWIEKAWIVKGANDNVPLEIVSWRDYVGMPNPTDAGEPTSLAYDGRISPTIYTWPVQTASTTIGYLGVVTLKDFDTAAGNPDLTVRYLNALTYGLAFSLADEYGLPMSERQWIQTQYEKHFKKAKFSDRDRADYEFVSSAFRS